MAKFRFQKSSLLAGEISPSAFGRTDLPQYQAACKTLRNMIPRLSGGSYRRPGTFFEKATDASSYVAPKLIEFVFSEDEAYCLYLLSDGASGGPVNALRPTNNESRSTASTVSGTHPYINDGFENEMAGVQHAQSGDVMWLVHPNHKPLTIRRTATDAFTVADFDSGLSGASLRDLYPYRAQNVTATTLAVNTATVGSGRTLTASTSIFKTSHVGAIFKINHAGTIGACKVTAYVSPTVLTVDVIVAFGATSAQTTWWESAWSNYRGWPRSVCFFKQRLVMGGCEGSPDTIFFSESGDYSQFSISTIVDHEASNGPTGSQPFQFTLLSQRLNLIQWVSAEKTLFVGSKGDEFVIDKAFQSTTTGFGGDNVQAEVQSHFGSMHRMPARAGEEILFGLGSKDEVRALVYNDTQSAYVAEPVQLFYDHYPKVDFWNPKPRAYREFVWDGSRKTLWCCDTAGNFFGMTRDRRLGVTAWHSHEMGGFDQDVIGADLVPEDLDLTLPAGSVVSLAVVPNPTIGMDDVWVAVKRKIDGDWAYHIERMIGGEFPYDNAFGVNSSTGSQSAGLSQYLVDAATWQQNEYPSAEDFTFDDLAHLEGEEVEGTSYSTSGIFSVAGSAVAAGVTTIQAPHPGGLETVQTTVIFGLPFDSIIEPVRPDAGSQIGSAQGAVKRIHKVNVRFHKTLSAKVGKDTDNLETVIFREGSTPMGKSPQLFTGDKEILVDSDYDKDGYLYILQDKPLPFSVTSIAAEGQTYD